jgi:hypothetical protein
VRQGCSLSPLLYILVLEPFAIKIREDEQISGVKLPGTLKTSKISLYANNSLAICTSDPSVRRVFYWCTQYGRASGAKDKGNLDGEMKKSFGSSFWHILGRKL